MMSIINSRNQLSLSNKSQLTRSWMIFLRTQSQLFQRIQSHPQLRRVFLSFKNLWHQLLFIRQSLKKVHQQSLEARPRLLLRQKTKPILPLVMTPQTPQTMNKVLQLMLKAIKANQKMITIKDKQKLPTISTASKMAILKQFILIQTIKTLLTTFIPGIGGVEVRP